jgi:hypothetical protein
VSLKVLFWNVRHINLAKVKDKQLRDAIVSVIAKADVCFIIENKVLPEEVIQELVKRLVQYGTFDGRSRFCGGYRATYENSIVLWNTMTTRVTHFDIYDLKGNTIPENASPSSFASGERLLAVATLQSRLRIGAVHLPGPGELNINSILITGIKILMPNLKIHLVGGDWNVSPPLGDFGGAQWIGPKQLDDKTPALTTFNSTYQLASPYDWVLMTSGLYKPQKRMPVEISVAEGWATKEKEWEVSDHLPVLLEIEGDIDKTFTLA